MLSRKKATKRYLDHCLRSIVNQSPPLLTVPKNFNPAIALACLKKDKVSNLFFYWLKQHVIPHPLQDPLKKNHLFFLRRYLLLKHELIRLIEKLHLNNTPYAILKGIPLEIQLHSNPATRISSDIDILIDQKHLIATHHILKKMGYQLKSVINEQQLIQCFHFIIEVGKDLTYLHPEKAMCIELHWKQTIMSAHGLPALSSLALSPQHSLSILAPEENFVYLCQHAAQHYWERKQWLIDIALFYQKYPLDWERIIEIAQKKHGIRPLLEAANLLENEFSIEINPIKSQLSDQIAIKFRLLVTKALWRTNRKLPHPLLVILNMFLYRSLLNKYRYLSNLLLHREKSMSQLKKHPNRSKIMLFIFSFFQKSCRTEKEIKRPAN